VIRTRTTDWRVQIRDENGRWQDHHAGTRAGPAIRAHAELDTNDKRLLRNGEPLRVSHTSEQLDLYEEGT
jgi:hypothetical protein